MGMPNVTGKIVGFIETTSVMARPISGTRLRYRFDPITTGIATDLEVGVKLAKDALVIRGNRGAAHDLARKIASVAQEKTGAYGIRPRKRRSRDR